MGLVNVLHHDVCLRHTHFRKLLGLPRGRAIGHCAHFGRGPGASAAPRDSSSSVLVASLRSCPSVFASAWDSKGPVLTTDGHSVWHHKAMCHTGPQTSRLLRPGLSWTGRPSADQKDKTSKSTRRHNTLTNSTVGKQRAPIQRTEAQKQALVAPSTTLEKPQDLPGDKGAESNASLPSPGACRAQSHHIDQLRCRRHGLQQARFGGMKLRAAPKPFCTLSIGKAFCKGHKCGIGHTSWSHTRLPSGCDVAHCQSNVH